MPIADTSARRHAGRRDGRTDHRATNTYQLEVPHGGAENLPPVLRRQRHAATAHRRPQPPTDGVRHGAGHTDVDNSGAVELSRDRKSCHRSRHVDRRYFKVRELYFQDVLRVEHVSTHDNVADLLTKPLQLSAFEKHRARAMNLEQRGGCK